MPNFISLLVLTVLFYCLGKSADIVVVNVRAFGERFGFKLFFLGILLGFFTSFPELSVGINAFLNDVPAISVGNLYGGVIVIFGLILGVSAILNREIKIEEGLDELMPLLTFLFFPVLLGLDGSLGNIDGLAIIVFYLVLLYYFLKKSDAVHDVVSTPEKTGVARSASTLIIKQPLAREAKTLFFIIGGLLGVLVFASAIIRITVPLLRDWGVSPFVIGLLVFSLGTNLPEIIITVRSWQRHIKDLSLSNLLGSAMANIFILGLFALMRETPIDHNAHYFVMAILLAIFLVVLGYTFETGKKITRREGIVFVSGYALFVMAQIAIEIYF